MARIISLVVLVVILLLLGGLFFQVMGNFLLPLFLALMLAVVFQPCTDGFGHAAAGTTDGPLR